MTGSAAYRSICGGRVSLRRAFVFQWQVSILC